MCFFTAECPAPDLDIVYVMDGSGSIGATNFDLAKEFVARTIETFDIGEYKSRVGVAQFSGSPRTEIGIGQIPDKEDLMTAVRNIP